MDDKRNYLSGSIMLSGNEKGTSAEKFTIRGVIGEGGSSICYDAVRRLADGSEESGKLKEFYPIDAVLNNKPLYHSMIRLPNGQLIAGLGTTRKFTKMCQDHIGAYRLLQKVMVDNSENEILRTYIHHNEVYYGFVSENDDIPEGYDIKKMIPTVYIWSPGVTGKNFDEYIQEVRKAPHKSSEIKLMDILSVMETLTDCIKAMHSAGLMHLDIKPSNFLVQYDTDGKLLTSNISMFDINSLASFDSKFIIPSGTEGFCAPEVVRGRVSNRTDIYSIGAMLFNAVVVTGDLPDGLYRDVFYNSIPMLLKKSELLINSDVNSDTGLMDRIRKILEKCLAADPQRRYSCCSDLKADIVSAKKRLHRLMNWPSASNDPVGQTEPDIVIQKLLYDHPLYEGIEDSVREGDINVLLIGSGTYGQKFIDICLQSGQMCGFDLKIDAISEDADEGRESYIRFRPAIKEFVNLDGCLEGKEDMAYADLNFRSICDITDNKYSMFAKKSSGNNKHSQVNSDIVNSALKAKDYNYVFIALGDDALNRSIAELCAEGLKGRCPISYVSEKKPRSPKRDAEKKLYHVYPDEPIELISIDELGEMAFNTHNVWNSAMNTDVIEERRKFFTSEEHDNRYNRISSLAFVLSIKYKLRGIQMEYNDMQKAADEFAKLLSDMELPGKEEEKKKFLKLVYLEHRRWVLEKVTNGWKAPRKKDGTLTFENCISRGKIKDNKNQTHPCIVHSTEEFVLDSEKYTENNHRLWDKGTIDPKLDELDKMSVLLHRYLKKDADRKRKDGGAGRKDIELILNMISKGGANIEKPFRQFCFALKNILNGSQGYSRQYNYYESIFKASLEALDKEERKKIEARLEVVKKEYFPVIETNLYRNYKKNDEVLIRKIPFILTYRHKKCIAAPFEDGKKQNENNEVIFSNVAAPTLLSPEKLCYLYCFNRDSSAELLIRKLDSVLNYFGKRKICCGVEIAIVCMDDISDGDYEELNNKLTELGKAYPKGSGVAWLECSKVYSADDNEQATLRFLEYLKEANVDMFNGRNRLFTNAYDNAMFINKISECGMPYFELDSKNKIYTKLIGCEHLRYEENDSYIRIEDMFALMNAEDNRFNMPELSDDYQKLWDIYTGSYIHGDDEAKKFEYGVGNWNHMCGLLNSYESNRKPLVRININTDEKVNYKMINYYLPEFTLTTVRALTQKLRDLKILERNSSIVSCASDSCRLEWRTNEKYAEQLKAVLDRYDILLPHYGVEAVECCKNGKRYVVIDYNDPYVENLELDTENKTAHQNSYNLLKKLDEYNFIRLMPSDKGNDGKYVSFVYSSNRIKKLLTSAGEILEIYAYYEALKTGYFDDVASGYEFKWESGNVKNELDLVLTKGFKSMFVECKAVVELKLDYYHKLHSISTRFGIGNINVMLGNTYKQSGSIVNDNNEMQKNRGDQLNIITVSDREDIINIGQTLVDIMKAN